jgi:hypothetical protein
MERSTDRNSKASVIEVDIIYIKEKLDSIERKIESQYATKGEMMLLKQELTSKIEQLDAIKKKVDIIVMLILTSVMGALLSLVIKK